MGKEPDNHYSDKGGHKARGEANRTRIQVERQFPDVPFMRPEVQLARRSMRRITESGRSGRR